MAPRHRLAFGALAAAVALLASACGGGPELVIEIVSPADGATVPAGQPVPIDVRITGGHIQGTGGEGRAGHLHLFVDRDLVEMTSEARPTVTLSPGVHLIMVEFSGEYHESLGITDEVEVTAE